MRRVVPVELGDSVIYAEVEDIDLVAAGTGDGELLDVPDRVADLVGRLDDQITATCVALHHSIRQAIDVVKPDEVTIEFGLMLGGEAGIPFVSKGKVEANVGITLKWDLKTPAAAVPPPPGSANV